MPCRTGNVYGQLHFEELSAQQHIICILYTLYYIYYVYIMYILYIYFVNYIHYVYIIHDLLYVMCHTVAHICSI